MIRSLYTPPLEKVDGLNIYRISIGIFCVIIFAMLSYIRNIAVFAKAHLFSNAMIVLTLTIVVIAGSI